MILSRPSVLVQNSCLTQAHTATSTARGLLNTIAAMMAAVFRKNVRQVLGMLTATGL